MKAMYQGKIEGFLEAAGLDEEPLGMFYTDQKPETGFSPKPGKLPSAEAEAQGAIDWGSLFVDFSCVMGNIWRARRHEDRRLFQQRTIRLPGVGRFTWVI